MSKTPKMGRGFIWCRRGPGIGANSSRMFGWFTGWIFIGVLVGRHEP